MARPDQLQLDPRAPLDDGLGQAASQLPRGAGTLEVTASPVSQVGILNRDQQLAQFSQNMSAFTGAVDHFAGVQSQQVEKHEKEQAVMDSIQNAGEPVLDRTQSAAYQETRMQMYGKQQAATALTDLNGQIAALKDDPEKLRNLDPHAFLGDWFQKNAAGIKDPTVAQEVYPMLQHSVASKIDDLITAKRAQFHIDQKKQEEATKDSAANYAVGALGAQGEAFTADNMWKTFDTLVPIVGEKEAAKIIVQSGKDAVVGGGVLAGADVLKAKNPRNGWGLERYLGSDDAARNSLNETHKFVEETRLKKQRDAEDEQKAQQKEIRADGLRLVDAKIEANQPIDPAEFANMLPGEKAERLVKIAKVQAPLIRAASIANAADTVGSDNVQGATQEELQKEFDKKVAVVTSTPVNPNDPASMEAYKGRLQALLLKHSDNNRTMSLKDAFVSLNGVEQLPSPADLNGQTAPDVAKALGVYKMLNAQPSLRPYLDKFEPKTKEFLRVVTDLEAGGVGTTAALNQAKTAMAPENLEARKVFVAQNADKIQKAVLGKLDTEILFGTSIGPLLKDTVAGGLPAWLETTALTVRDPEVLTKMYLASLQKQVFQVTDPTVTHSWMSFDKYLPGANTEKRAFLRPANPAGLNDTELGDAVLLSEKSLGEAWSKGPYGSGEYTLRPTPGNAETLQVYKDGQPFPVGPVKWDQVTGFYKKNMVARTGMSKFKEAPPVKDEETARKEATAYANNLYNTGKAAEDASKNLVSRGTVTLPSKDKAPHVEPLPMANVPPKPELQKTRSRDRSQEEPKGRQAPEVTDQALSMLGTLTPSIRAQLPKGIRVELPPKMPKGQ